MSANDFKVRAMWPDQLADVADRWRKLDKSTYERKWFDTTVFLTEIVLPQLASKGRSIQVELVEDNASEQAWVDFERGKVFFRKEIWEAARQQQPRARLIVAHEIGHLALHDDQPLSFTKAYDYGLAAIEKSESAEYQANWFAWALLLPDILLLKMMKTLTVSSIATLALVEERLVECRIDLVSRDHRYRSFSGDECSQCGSMRLLWKGNSTVCLDCP